MVFNIERYRNIDVCVHVYSLALSLVRALRSCKPCGVDKKKKKKFFVLFFLKHFYMCVIDFLKKTE